MDSDSSEYTLESDWETDVEDVPINAFTACIMPTLGRVAALSIRNDIWTDLIEFIGTKFAWNEQNPIMKTTGDYKVIVRFRDQVLEAAGRGHVTDIPVHQRKALITILRPIDLVVLMPFIISDHTRYQSFINGVDGILTMNQLRALYLYVSVPLEIQKEYLAIPDLFKTCHDIVLGAIEDKTAVARLKQNNMPDFIHPQTIRRKHTIRWMPAHANDLLPPDQRTKKVKAARGGNTSRSRGGAVTEAPS